MKYIEPKAIIVDAKQKGKVSKIIIKVDKILCDPLAPAGLYFIEESQTERFQLHNIIRKEGGLLIFETYSSNHELPHKKEIYIYRPWWIPIALEAVLDKNVIWEKRKYPNNGDHDHCLFTWKEIAAYSENKTGYYSDKYGWITVDSYNRFIKNDIYKLRKT